VHAVRRVRNRNVRARYFREDNEVPMMALPGMHFGCRLQVLMTHSDDTGPTRGSSGPDDGALEHERALRLVQQRFPHIKAASLQLLDKQEAFRDLCDEYAACTAVLERLTDAASDQAMHKEYSALRLRVEGELLRYVSDHGGGGP
jgi:hypothetical protein